MKNDSCDPLPKATLVGVVLSQMVRCGSSNCKCARGLLHGPYYYRFWRQAGKLCKQYVRPADVERVRLECETRRQLDREERKSWFEWRQMSDIVREAEES